MSAVRTLGKYEIRRQLGRGAMGTVHEGWDPIIKRQVAIKTVRLPEVDDNETIEEIARFRREAEAAGRLNHPNIVGVFDYGETTDLAYIVMEYVDGPTLKSLLDKQERFPLPSIVRIMEDLLSGLQYSHERGVVHRDIKPANLMLTASGQAKITDFGIARIESSSMTQAGTILGTPAYMSPEQFLGHVSDGRSDIYSAGVLLYQLLTGERPFDGGMSTIMHKALNTEPTAPSRIAVTAPRQFDAVVLRAMAKRPDERFQSAREFASAIRAAFLAPVEPPEARQDQADEATVVATPRSRLALPATGAEEATMQRRAAPMPAAASGVVPAARKRPLILGVSAGGVAVLGGIGYFLLAGGPAPIAPRHEPEQPPAVVSAPPPAASPVAAPPVVAQSPDVGPAAVPEPAPAAPPVIVPPPVAVQPPAAQTPPATDQTPPVTVALTPPAAAPGTPPPLVTEPPPGAGPPVAQTLPVPSQTEPTPPASIPPLERVRAAARSLPCSALHVAIDSDGLRVSGVAVAGPDLDKFVADARRLGRLSNDISDAEPFACAALSAFAPLARQSWEGEPRPLTITLDTNEPVSGARFGISAATALPTVYLDLYRDDGMVYHLSRPDLSRRHNDPHNVTPVAPSPGPGLIVAVASAARLLAGPRPERERAAEYLALLQTAMRSSSISPEVDLTMITVRPPPEPRRTEPGPVKNRPEEPRRRAMEPVATRGDTHNPALRSARCSNIINRAQLGETLTNAELMALRNECRY